MLRCVWEAGGDRGHELYCETAGPCPSGAESTLDHHGVFGWWRLEDGPGPADAHGGVPAVLPGSRSEGATLGAVRCANCGAPMRRRVVTDAELRRRYREGARAV
jgi:hypothetical protein